MKKIKPVIFIDEYSERIKCYDNGTFEKWKNKTIERFRYEEVTTIFSSIRAFNSGAIMPLDLTTLALKNIEIYIITDKYGLITILPEESMKGDGKIIVQQALNYKDNVKRLNIAKKFEKAFKCHLYNLMKYYAPKEDSKVRALLKAVAEISFEECYNIEEMLGKEARMVKKFYAYLRHTLPEYTFPPRNYHPPKDPFNALLSYGNTLLYATTLTLVNSTHLSPQIGFVHSIDGSSKKSPLVLDVADIFKPLTVYNTIIHMFRYRLIRPEELYCSKNYSDACYLNAKVLYRFRKVFFNLLHSKTIIPAVTPAPSVISSMLKFLSLLRATILYS